MAFKLARIMSSNVASIEHADAMAKLTSELVQRSARIDTLSNALEERCEEQEILRANCKMMQEQLSELKAVVTQRLEAEQRKALMPSAAPATPAAPAPPQPPPPVDVSVDVANDDDDDDENGVYVLPDGSLSTVPPPMPAPAGMQPPPVVAATTAAAAPYTVPDALRQPLRAIDEAFARARTAKGELDARLEEAMAQGFGKELAAWGRNGREALEKLRPSKRSE